MAPRLEDGRAAPKKLTAAQKRVQGRSNPNYMEPTLARAAVQWQNANPGSGTSTRGVYDAMRAYASQPARTPTPVTPRNTGTAVSRGTSYGRGGGGGGGGGNAAAAAQAQIDALTKLVGSSAYKVDPAQYDAMRTTVGNATAQDQAAATGAYNSLDTWLQTNQTNPYANVQLQRAQTAPSYNPFLESQGVQGTATPAENPYDGGYGAFQNILSLLGANQLAGNNSRQAEAQMARSFTTNQIGAVDNAYLAQIADKQSNAQAALDAEKRQQITQLMALLATPGTKAPDLATLGYT